MKMPTCNFEIGDCFTVTKDGALETIDDMADSEEVENGGSSMPSPAESKDSSQSRRSLRNRSRRKTPRKRRKTDETGLTVELPLDKVAVGTLTNILEAKGTLIKKALGIDDLRFEIRDDKHRLPLVQGTAHAG
jgi:hypothetical protein